MNFYMYRLSHPPGVYVLIRCLSVLMEKYLVKVGCGCHVAWNIRVDTWVMWSSAVQVDSHSSVFWARVLGTRKCKKFQSVISKLSWCCLFILSRSFVRLKQVIFQFNFITGRRNKISERLLRKQIVLRHCVLPILEGSRVKINGLYLQGESEWLFKSSVHKSRTL